MFGFIFFYLVVILCLLHQKTKKKGEDLVFFGLRVGCACPVSKKEREE